MPTDLTKFTVSPNHSLHQTMQTIDVNGYGIALVIDPNQTLLGVVTDGDIRKSIINGTPLHVPITQVMNPSPYVLEENSNIPELFSIVLDKKIRGLPVIDKDKKVEDLLLGEEIAHVFSKRITQSLQGNAKRKHVLIVGGAGYIGSVLARILLKEGHKVRVLDKLMYSSTSLESLKEDKNFKLIVGDIGDIATVTNAIKDVDVVVQLAEIVGDPACAVDPQKTQQINHLSTLLLANVCKYFQVNRFIYASSCSVYGESENNELLHEQSTQNPVSLYARMKQESEKILLNMNDNLFSPTIVRFATVFGKSPRMRFDLVVNTLTIKAIKEGKITIFGGDQWRPFVHVSDAARALSLLVDAPLHKIKGEIFNVGSSHNNFTINDIGKMVKEVNPASELVIEDKNVDKRNYKVDFSKIEKSLGYKALVDVKEGIKEMSGAIKDSQHDDYLEDKYYNDRVCKKELSFH